MKHKTKLVIFTIALLVSACNGTGVFGRNADAPETKDLAPEPTESVLSDDQYFREEFEDDINKNWGMKLISGLEDQLVWSQANGKFRLQLLPPNDTNFVFFHENAGYKDVIVQAEFENYGQLDTAFSVMCRVTTAGWYELRISPQGYYELLRFDQYKKDEGDNAYTNYVEKRIGSTFIIGGLEKNVFALSCEDNQLKVFINGEQVYKDKRPLTIEDDTYSEGTIGFGVLGYGKDADVTINWIETLKP